MKKMFLVPCICILFGCFGKDPVFKSGHEGESMPSFNFLLLDSTTYINTANISSKKPIVFFFFSPYCTYCKALTQEIIEHNKIFEEIQMVMLSNFPLKTIKEFSIQYKLDDYSNIIVGQDFKQFFGQYYKVPGVPSIAIYSKKRELKQVLLGLVSPDQIKEIAMN